MANTGGNRNSATVYPCYVSPPPNAPLNQIQATTTKCYNFDPYVLKRTIIRCLGCLISHFIWFFFFIFVPKFRLETVTISNVVHRPLADDYLISGDLEAHFILHNPNSKLSLHYHQIEAAVCYRNKLIAKTTTVVPPFVQGPKNETAIRVIFTDFTGGHIVDIDGFNGGATHAGYVWINFDFRMMATYRPSSAWKAGGRIFKVYCPHLLIAVSLKTNDGTLIGGWENCITTY